VAYARFTYDPWETTPEERKATFVGREVLLGRLFGAIREQEGRSTVQHYLVLGPRGIGKTSLLLVLRDRLHEDADLSKRWFCVQLREEEYYIRTLRDLLDLVLQALHEDEKVPEAEEILKRVRAEKGDDASRALALDGLRGIVQAHRKRLLLLIDNFDQLFPSEAAGKRKKKLPDSEYRTFRKLLSTESFLMVIGASAREFCQIAAYDEAFFNFFSPVELPNLTDEEINEVLRGRAALENDREFLGRLAETTDKVRAVTQITGGNPRIVVMLYDVLRERRLVNVVEVLRETVSSLTPMYKHVLDDMPRQQSKTLDALIRLGGAVSPARLAEHARLPLNAVTTQLGRLKEERFVTPEGEGKGSPATYRVKDPMFRTWYQVRYLKPRRRRIELLVEFLRAWFSVEERREHLDRLRPLAVLLLRNNRPDEAAGWMARMSSLEPKDTPLEQRLEARIRIVESAGRDFSLDAAAKLLEALLNNDPEELRSRLAFLKPALDFARTGDEGVLSKLPDEERDAARRIAAAMARRATPEQGPPAEGTQKT
jgi:hypothetical protein